MRPPDAPRSLLSNAIKFTAPGGTIGLGVEPHPDDVRISVRDTGRGIPADRLRTIFEPFVQIDRHTGANETGVGLGLAISRDLALRMEGDLIVSSEVGVGSTFVLTLPRGRSRRAVDPAARLKSPRG